MKEKVGRKMPDKKLTDSEIIKAFECCYCDKPCRECPYYVNFECTLPKDDTEFLPKKMTEIINRLQCERNKYRRKVQNQREEINRLQARIDHNSNNMKHLVQSVRGYQKTLEQAKAENERLKEVLNTDFFIPLESDDTSSMVVVKIDSIKAEAYKEFAKRLKHKAINIGVNDSIVSTYDIDNLLKELVGEDNA